MRDRHALALDVRAAHRGGVQQQVDQVVVQQVDLVDVQHAAVRGGQQAGLVGAHALGQRALQVAASRRSRSSVAPTGSSTSRAGRAIGRRPVGVRPVRAVGSGAAGSQREPAARHDVHRRQQRGQRAHRGRLRGALLAADQHPADRRGARR